LLVVGCALLLAACGGGGGDGGDDSNDGVIDLGETRFGVPGVTVFTDGPNVLVEDADGVEVLVAATGTFAMQAPVLSPDGSRVAYVAFDQSFGSTGVLGSDLRVVTLSGSDEAVLVHAVAGEFYAAPRWLADGSALVYAHQIEGSDEAGRTFLVDVERIELASGVVTVLRENARDPDVSPNGQLLVFVDEPAISDRLVVQDLASNAGVLVASIDQGLNTFRVPQFSPDGEWIGFMASGEGPEVRALDGGGGASSVELVNRNGAQDLWLVRPDGSGLRRITNVIEDAPDFSWSDDGTQALIRGAFGVYLVDVEARVTTTLGPGEFHGSHDWRGVAAAVEGE
jgi:Tol biopolymer transport system component